MKAIHLLSTFALIGLTLGCRDSDTQEDFANRQHQKVLQATNRALATNEGSNQDSFADASAEENSEVSGIQAFASKFAEQFNKDRQKAFHDLVFWDGISGADREKNMQLFLSNESFIDGLDGEVRGNPGFQKFEEYASFVSYLQLPDSVFVNTLSHLVLLHIVNKDENITQVWYPVIKVDDRFYICPAKSKP